MFGAAALALRTNRPDTHAMGARLTRRTVLAVLAAPAVLRAGTAPLLVGALYPLSGPSTVLGDESFRGLELAVEERNAAGGLLGRTLQELSATIDSLRSEVAELRTRLDGRP